jgi:hypothetical protein
MKFYLFILLFFIIIFFGCEKEATITYSVFNTSNSAVKVVFFNSDGKDQNTFNKLDSIEVQAGEQKAITTQGKGLSSVGNNRETEKYLREFKTMNLYQNRKKSTTDFLLSEKWDYLQSNSHQATYTSTIRQSDF